MGPFRKKLVNPFQYLLLCTFFRFGNLISVGLVYEIWKTLASMLLIVHHHMVLLVISTAWKCTIVQKFLKSDLLLYFRITSLITSIDVCLHVFLGFTNFYLGFKVTFNISFLLMGYIRVDESKKWKLGFMFSNTITFIKNNKKFKFSIRSRYRIKYKISSTCDWS